MEKLDALFKSFYFGFADVAKWIFCIKIARDIIKNMESSDIHGVLKSLMNGSAGYACIYAANTVLESIQQAFKK